MIPNLKVWKQYGKLPALQCLVNWKQYWLHLTTIQLFQYVWSIVSYVRSENQHFFVKVSHPYHTAWAWKCKDKYGKMLGKSKLQTRYWSLICRCESNIEIGRYEILNTCKNKYRKTKSLKALRALTSRWRPKIRKISEIIEEKIQQIDWKKSK